jgi:hypothetical protein
MAIIQFTQQPTVGVRRALRVGDLEQIITILRIVEQLPVLSGTDNCNNLQTVTNHLYTIHKNHRELSLWANSLLDDISKRGE